MLEASDQVGGRIRTDEVDGFLVDRGFQLLNPAYPAVRRLVDVDALSLQAFGAGVSARFDDGQRLLGHPVRRPGSIASTTRAVWNRPGELLAVARWAAPLLRPSRGRGRLGERLEREVVGTLRESLDRAGLDGRLRHLLDRFLAGVVLDDEGTTPAAFALLLARAFAAGVPGLPADGMQALPRQLASGLEGRVSFGHRVGAIDKRSVGYALAVGDGPLLCRHVVVATGPRQAAALTGAGSLDTRGVVTQWFATDDLPTQSDLLHVDARPRSTGPVINTAVVSNAAPSYSPSGQHLVQASALLSRGARPPSGNDMARHAAELLGTSQAGWQTVARHEIPDALPAQPTPFTERRPVVVDHGVVVCGDHRDTASIQGALVSGERAASALLEAPRPTGSARAHRRGKPGAVTPGWPGGPRAARRRRHR